MCECVCEHVCECVSVCVCECACVCVSVHTFVCVHMHVNKEYVGNLYFPISFAVNLKLI